MRRQKRKTNLWKGVFCTLASFGIYGVYWRCRMLSEIKALRHSPGSGVWDGLCLSAVPLYALFLWGYTEELNLGKAFPQLEGSIKKQNRLCLALYLTGLGVAADALLQRELEQIRCLSSTGETIKDGKTDFKTG